MSFRTRDSFGLYLLHGRMIDFFFCEFYFINLLKFDDNFMIHALNERKDLTYFESCAKYDLMICNLNSQVPCIYCYMCMHMIQERIWCNHMINRGSLVTKSGFMFLVGLFFNSLLTSGWQESTYFIVSRPGRFLWLWYNFSLTIGYFLVDWLGSGQCTHTDPINCYCRKVLVRRIYCSDFEQTAASSLSFPQGTGSGLTSEATLHCHDGMVIITVNFIQYG